MFAAMLQDEIVLQQLQAHPEFARQLGPEAAAWVQHMRSTRGQPRGEFERYYDAYDEDDYDTDSSDESPRRPTPRRAAPTRPPTAAEESSAAMASVRRSQESAPASKALRDKWSSLSDAAKRKFADLASSFRRGSSASAAPSRPVAATAAAGPARSGEYSSLLHQVHDDDEEEAGPASDARGGFASRRAVSLASFSRSRLWVFD